MRRTRVKSCGIIYNPTNFKAYSLILFDTVSGGSGHVKRLIDDNSLTEVLKNAYIKVSQECCSEDTSCYNCLRTYNNQRLHKHIKRGLAKKALMSVINKRMYNNKNYIICSCGLSFASVGINTFLELGYIDDSQSKNSIISLFKEINDEKCQIPDGYGYVLKEKNNGDMIHADFAWVDRKILLFTIENIDSFNKIVNSQNTFECYLLTDSFDYVSFVKKIRG